MPNYILHELDEKKFEDLVVHICIDWLGEGVNCFAAGRDGGRDARFIGTASKYPSPVNPWSGKFIIQAKHTSSPIGKVSDSTFYNYIKGEYAKISRLLKNAEIDNYLLFTNNSLPAGQNCKIIEDIRNLGINNNDIIGRERIHKHLDNHPNLVKILKLNLYNSPFDINQQDMIDIVNALHSSVKNSTTENFDYIDKKKKNKINNLSEEYFEYIKENSLPLFGKIEKFFKNPRNEEYADYYLDITNELKAKIINHQEQFERFDDVFEFLYDSYINSDETLRRKKRYVSILLHYMYYTCDIGKHD